MMGRTYAPPVNQILLVTGERSADIYGADVVRQLHSLIPGLHVDVVGGSMLAREDVSVIARIESLTVMGLAETAARVPAHLKLFHDLSRRLKKRTYDLVILIDYPGFNLRVASVASKMRTPVLYYVAPQLWAWNAGRAKRIKRDVSALAVVLPFEREYFRSLGLTAQFVGHPLLDRPPAPSRKDARAKFGIPDGVPVLSLFPGSREAEIARMWKTFERAAHTLRSRIPDLHVIVASPRHDSNADQGFIYCDHSAQIILAAADAAICKSGTTVLECALSDTPMVVAYRMHPISFFVARRLVKVRHIALVNLIADARVVPEFIQGQVTSEKLADAAAPLLDASSVAAQRQREAFIQVRRSLGHPGAGKRVAGLAAKLVA